MKYLLSSLSISFAIILFLSCADYDLMEKSLHPDGVDLSIVNVSDTSVTLSWTRYTGEDFNSYKVYCSRNDAIDTTDSLADSLHFAIDTTKTIRGLNVGTLYYFRVMVTTREGGVGVSNIVDTTTILSMKGHLKLYPPDTAQTTDSSVTLRWSTCISNFKTYKLYMDTTSDVDNKDTLVQTIYTDTAATIRGLQQGRNYSFIVYAMLDTSVVAKSDVMETHTTANSLNKPIVLSIVDSTDTTVLLRWSRYGGNDFKCYKIYRSPGSFVSLNDSLLDSLIVKAETTYTARSLKPGESYTFHVMVIRLRGDPLSSNNAPAITTNVQKTHILLFGPDLVTDSSVYLRWTKCNFAINSYRVLLGTSAKVDTVDSIVAENYITNKGPPDTTAVIKGLSRGVIYWFRVFALNKAGEYAAWSNPMDVLAGKKY